MLPTNEKTFDPNRAMDGYSGKLILEGEILTPLHVREDDEPSYTDLVDGQVVQGWDFYSQPMSAHTEQLEENKRYILSNKLLSEHLDALYLVGRDLPKLCFQAQSLDLP